MADTDVIDGKAKQVEGKVQNAWGNLTGDVEQQVKGAAKQVEGKVQEGWGKVTHRIDSEREKRAAEADADVVTADDV